MPKRATNRVGAQLLIGKSTHSVEQAVAAGREGADYIGFGPLFATPTKPDYAPIGIDQIRRVHELVKIPIFCIGGIKLRESSRRCSRPARSASSSSPACCKPRTSPDALPRREKSLLNA